MTPDKPVLFVTGHAPPDRHGAFAALHAREPLELALYGGRHAHAAPASEEPPVPHRRVSQRQLFELAASRRYRAVIAGTGGRVALPAAWAGARRGATPFLYWAALWAHPRSVAHAASYPLLRHLYRHADAVVTYGEHVSAYVTARGARNVHIAPQSVDNAYWSAGAPRALTRDREHDREHDRERDRDPARPLRALFVGRDDPAKGLASLLEAWARSGLADGGARLDLVGELRANTSDPLPGTHAHGPADAGTLRNFYAAADVLVIPSIATRTFREPWGLVANEAMNQRTAIIATDRVGAAAGGLVRHERNGLIVNAGDSAALAAALRRLDADRDLCMRLGDAGARDVAAFSHNAWAAGFQAALASVAAGTRV